MSLGVRLGVVVMPVDSWPDTRERTRELEALGFDHLWLYDHLSWRHYRDRAWHATMPWLAAIAVSTSHVGIGTMVANPALRHPLTLAKDAMTLDHLSNGRLIVGIGAGTTGFDASTFGQEPLAASQRAARLEEYVSLLDGLLRGTVRNHSGHWYTVDEGRIIPGCIQQPRVPIAVASGGPRTTALAAVVADAWITLGNRAVADPDPTEHRLFLERQLQCFSDSCERAGRDPDEVRKINLVSATFSAPMSSIEAFVEFAGTMADLGFTDVVVHDSRADDPALDHDPGLIDAIAALAPSRPQ